MLPPLTCSNLLYIRPELLMEQVVTERGNSVCVLNSGLIKVACLMCVLDSDVAGR